jgi:hypothetical protein
MITGHFVREQAIQPVLQEWSAEREVSQFVEWQRAHHAVFKRNCSAGIDLSSNAVGADDVARKMVASDLLVSILRQDRCLE